jgi:phenylalanyl-tRNA synthetase beta chain
MICAEDELGLGTNHDGIMVLDEGTPTGTAAADYFQVETDTVFEIGLTPNRIDAASHLGVARDLAAYLNQQSPVTLKRPSLEQFSVDNTELHIPVEIDEPAGCKRYSGLTLSGVTVTESPGWLKNRLKSIGLTPINNVVDITNYVLHEAGQPLHAFDAQYITGQKVVVRTMPEGTKFITLDEQERELLPTDLMICNASEGMCIAGVFGGIQSGVTETTSNIFLESACFDPVYVRKTAKHHLLNTDASFRFERGSDPNLTVWALKRTALLIRELAGGNISSDVIDVYPEPVEDFRVEISYANVNRLIGNPMEPSTIKSILESLEIRVAESSDNGMVVLVPPYRVDVQREADIVEEILRIYGFNRVRIGSGLRSNLSYSEKPDKELVINTTSDLLTSKGFFELKSNSLTRSAYYDKEDRPDPEAVRLFNPLSQDLSVMRKTLLYGGLEAIAYNINRKNPDLKLYEFGYCYQQHPDAQQDELLERFQEELHLGIFLTGSSQPGNWIQSAGSSSFYGLKTYVETLLTKLGIDPYHLDSSGLENPDYSEGLTYSFRGETVAVFGAVNGVILKKFDLKQPVYAAELNWDLVLRMLAERRILFTPLPKFHVVTRDFSLMLDKSVTFESLRSMALKTEKKLLKKVTLFDVYEGDKIEKGKKSYALSFTLLDKDKTLTDKQIDKVMLNLARVFEKEFGAQVRGMN